MNELKILLFLSLNLNLVLCSEPCLGNLCSENAERYEFDIFVNKTSEDVYNKQIYPKARSIVQSNFH
jgi:hypothetical protein